MYGPTRSRLKSSKTLVLNLTFIYFVPFFPEPSFRILASGTNTDEGSKGSCSAADQPLAINTTSNLSLPTSSSTSSMSSIRTNPAWYEMTDTSRCSEGDESIADFSVPGFGYGSSLKPSPQANEGVFCRPQNPPLPSPGSSSSSGRGLTSFVGSLPPGGSARRKLSFEEKVDNAASSQVSSQMAAWLPPPLASEDLHTDNASFEFAQKVSDTVAKEAEVAKEKPQPLGGKSGLFLYVDIHGHASKRGIFMYGNHFVDMDTKIDSMLLPKLMSINCANFDFPACNFTERNMFLKDRHTGAGKRRQR